jgi:hypothetical protein
MKTLPSSPEFNGFVSAMRDILKVTPEEIQKREKQHKESGKRLSKGSACLDSGVSKLVRDAFSHR